MPFLEVFLGCCLKSDWPKVLDGLCGYGTKTLSLSFAVGNYYVTLAFLTFTNIKFVKRFGLEDFQGLVQSLD